MFRNPVLVPSSTGDEVLYHLLKMEPIQGSETSAFNNNQTLGKYPEELLSSLQHGESLKLSLTCSASHLGRGSCSGREKLSVIDDSSA